MTISKIKCNFPNLCLFIWLIFPAEKTTAQIPFPDLIINSTYIGSGTVTYSNSNAIISPTTPTSYVAITNSAQVDFKAGTYVKLKPGFSSFDFVGSGKFKASIQTNDFETVIMEPTVTPGIVGKLEKFEMGLQLPASVNTLVNNYLTTGTGINPYDPDQISIEATFTSPTGVQKLIYGFFYKEFIETSGTSWAPQTTNYPWRVRFAPNEIGTWTCAINVISPSFSLLKCNNMHFDCIASGNKGYLQVGQYNRQLRFSETHTSFFAVGQNIAWANDWTIPGEAQPADYAAQRSYIQDLHDDGGNYTRLVLAPWSEAVEWEKVGDYDARQRHLWELDQIFDLAHNINIYLHLCIEMHTQYQTFHGPGIAANVPYWASNPYKTIPGVNNPIDFFTNPTAQNYFKKRLRYLVARWGYSTNLSAYELFSEVDQVDGYASNIPTVLNWHINMINYIKTNLGENKHLISTSYSGAPDPNLFNLSSVDITSKHSYSQNNDPGVNFGDYGRFGSLIAHPGEVGLSSYNKPYIFGEAGAGVETETCTDVEMHNTLWSTTFMGGFGSSIYWWNWENPTYRKQFIALSSFINGEDFESNHYFPQEEKDIYGSNDHGVENYSLVNSSGSRAIGYIQNRYNYWNTIPSCGTRSIINIGSTTKLKVRDLQAWPVKFEIDLYRTPSASPVSLYTSYTGERANLAGTLKIKIHLPFNDAKDYAYRIFKTSNHSAESDKFFPVDTLDCPNDTLRFTGIFKEDTLGTQLTYNWNFGNGQTSYLAHPKVYYTQPGIYSVVLILSEPSTGIIDTLTQQFVLTSCDSNISQKLFIANSFTSIENKTNFKLYPNPNNGKFTLETDHRLNFIEINVYDVLGKIVYKRHLFDSEKIDIDMKNKDKGMYFIKVIENGNILYSSKFILN